MIHAYRESDVSYLQRQLGTMFQVAVLFDHMDIDEFAQRFIASPISHSLEILNPKYAFGMSGLELVAIVLNREPEQIVTDGYSPEYWVGWVLAYAQWYFNRTYAQILERIPAGKILENYFPYHEMDISESMEFIGSYLGIENQLRRERRKRKMSQRGLSLLSGVPLRTIRAYEQGTLDIAKAQGETLYYLARALGCSIEDLIL